MNAYLTYDRIEDRRWVEQQLTDEKEKWIDDRAKELIAMFPAKPLEMSSLFLPQKPSLRLSEKRPKRHTTNTYRPAHMPAPKKNGSAKRPARSKE